jgi:DNA-binding protein H-NS
MSKKLNLHVMSIDEMWQLHEEVIRILSVKLTSEKRELEKRLAQLRREKKAIPQSETIDWQLRKDLPDKRRKYPKVFPKYRNPSDPSETWSGRGKQPRWLNAALEAGHVIEEFVIRNLDLDENNRRRTDSRVIS